MTVTFDSRLTSILGCSIKSLTISMFPKTVAIYKAVIFKKTKNIISFKNQYKILLKKQLKISNRLTSVVSNERRFLTRSTFSS